ncbi:MAG: hypothetical protein E3J72_00750 [Planctomycetota bacterium]|nr:MAG: hypothetical protein E3J72_00750 [Planctomycetota bacterium]
MWRRIFISILTFVAGLYFFFEYVMPRESGLTDIMPEIGPRVIIIGVTAIFLGMINLTRMHLHKVVRRRPGWYNSLACIIAIYVMFLLTVLQYFFPKTAWVIHTYDTFFQYVRIPLDATIFSLLAYYIASAAYRAFRIKSVEATVMLAVALFVMLGQIPMGQAITRWLPETGYLSWFRLENIKLWIMDVPNSAATRGILFGGMIGTLAMSLRLWLSLERGSFFDAEV